MFFVEAFFESIIHGIDGGFALFVPIECVEVGFLKEKN